jgi:hypothetical protein
MDGTAHISHKAAIVTYNYPAKTLVLNVFYNYKSSPVYGAELDSDVKYEGTRGRGASFEAFTSTIR